jgi:hypothetical protein
LRRGMESMLAPYPDSSSLSHRLGWLACAYGDRETAKPLFRRLRYGLDGDSEDVWGAIPKYFDKCAAWALGKTPMYEITAVDATSWCGAPDVLEGVRSASELCLAQGGFSEKATTFEISISPHGDPKYPNHVAMGQGKGSDRRLCGCMLGEMRIPANMPDSPCKIRLRPKH